MAWNVQMGDELAAWPETGEHMLYNAFALEGLLEDHASPAWFPVGEDALENATGRESPVVKRGGGKKPQVRIVRMETRCLHTSSLLTAHTAHARVVPTCQRPLRTL